VALGRDGSIIVTVQRYNTDVRDNVYALDPADGRVRWSTRLPSGAGGSPLVDADGGIYVTAGNPLICAFDPNGKRTWSAPVGLGTAALGPDGTVYVADSTSCML
jgi:outer membrane protein assembly factor BamB